MRTFFANLICALIPFRKLRSKIRGKLGMLFSRPRTLQPVPEIEEIDFFQNDFPDYISIVLMIKNEAKFLPEWLEFHILMGVSKFYIYDNESTDNIKEILEPYIRDGLVEYIFWPSKEWKDYKDNNHFRSCRDALERCRYKTKWMIILDSDEFLQPMVSKDLHEFLLPFDNAGIAQIGVNWHVFGTGGHLKAPHGLLCENYRFRQNKNCLNKSIVNPRSIIEILVHYHRVSGATVDENMNLVASESKCNGEILFQYTDSAEKIRVVHYQSKSMEDWQNKLKRGYNVRKNNTGLFFEIDDSATIYDDKMASYAPAIKEAIKKSVMKENVISSARIGQ